VRHLEELVQAGLELPTVNQVEAHPFCQQREIATWCNAHGVIIQAYCPVMRMAAGKIDHPVLVRVADKACTFRATLFQLTHSSFSLQLSRKPTQIAIRWSLQRGFVPLPKSTHEERIAENADVFSFTIPPEDMEAFDLLDLGAAGAVTWNPVNDP